MGMPYLWQRVIAIYECMPMPKWERMGSNMRLIDADSVLKWFDEYWAMQKKLGRPSKQQRAIYMTMRSMVNSVKTEDAVPVVRCCDCKYYEEQDETIGTCLLTESGAYIEGYCSWAEVKEE